MKLKLLMNKHITLLVILLTICSNASLAQSDAVEKALNQYISALTVDAANQFFALLDREQFTEEKIQFSSKVPADSVRQQVWYWASEWFYDQQDYNQGKDYGLKALKLYHGASESKADCLNLPTSGWATSRMRPPMPSNASTSTWPAATMTASRRA